MTSLSFFVPGEVSAQGSKRHVGRGVLVDMNRNLAPWRDSICYAARKAAQTELNWRDQHGPIFTSAVALTLEAIYVRPKSHFRTGKNSHVLRDDAPHWKISAPDFDKIWRAAGDAITQSGVWKDDALVACLDEDSGKRYAYGNETPGLLVSIKEVS